MREVIVSLLNSTASEIKFKNLADKHSSNDGTQEFIKNITLRTPKD